MSISLGAVDLPALVPDLDAARRREGGARGLALRRADHAGRAGRLRDSGLRARRVPDRAVRRRQLLRAVPAARPDLGQLGRAALAGAHRRLLLASDPAADLPRDRQLRGRHDADQEHLRRGDAQAVRAGRARQGPVAAPRALQAHLSQCADPAGHRLSGGLRRRVLRRLAADRDAVLARRARAAVVRVGGPARLSRSCSARCTCSR